MLNDKFEQILANHCSPVLMGTKLSNLISVTKADFVRSVELISTYNEILNPYGIVVDKLCECEARMLLLVYNEERLARHLKKTRVANFLNAYGYKSSEINDCIAVLKTKLRHFEFPHEIGIFLGFPIDDVIGFIENQGQNYVYCGYWKVYTKFESTKRTFDLYDSLRAFVKERLLSGYTIDKLMQEIYQNKKALHSLIKAA